MRRILSLLLILLVILIGLGCGSVANDSITALDKSDDSVEQNDIKALGTVEQDPSKDFDFVTNGFKLHIPAGALPFKYRVIVTSSSPSLKQNSFSSGMVFSSNLFNVAITPVSSSNLAPEFFGSALEISLQKPAKVTLILNELRNESSDYFIGNCFEERWEVISSEIDSSVELVMHTFNAQGDFCILQQQLGTGAKGLKGIRLFASPKSLAASNTGVLSSNIEVSLQLENSSNSSFAFSPSQVQMIIFSPVSFNLELANVSEGTTKFSPSQSNSMHRITFSMVNQSYIKQLLSGNIASLSFNALLQDKVLNPFPTFWRFKAFYKTNNITYVSESFVNFSQLPVDGKRLTVLSTVPVDDSLEVETDAVIAINFDDNILPNSVSSSSVIISVEGNFVAGTYEVSNNIIKFIPGENFPYGSKIEVKVLDSVLGIEKESVAPYSFSFFSKSKPIVTAYSPVFVTNIPVTEQIQLNFSRTMDKATTLSAFNMLEVANSSKVSGSFIWTPDSKSLVFKPDFSLSYNSTYSVSIGVDALDGENIPLSATTSWQFSTTAGNPPKFVTEPFVKRITQNSASVTCEIGLASGAYVLQKGFVWGTTQNPTLESHSAKTEAGAGTGIIISNLTDLNADTNYFLKAYAINAAGIVYSPEKVFSTHTDFGGSGGLFDGGDGSETHPFQVSTIEQFNNIQNGSDSSYILTSDLNIEDGTVGRFATFTGKLNGNDFKINNYSAYPLFEKIGTNSELLNLYVNASPGSFFLSRYGAIAGLNYGAIKNSKVSINLSQGSDSYQGPIGSIVGGNLGKIEGCLVEGQLEFALSSLGCGGISGYCATNSQVLNCKFEGTINSLTIYGAGGIVGFNQGGAVVNCIASSSITTSSIFANFGGSGGGIAGTNNAFISGCSAYGAISSGSGALNCIFGGIAGDNTGGMIVDCNNYTNIQ